MKASILFSSLVALALFTGGCAGMRYVHRTPAGGTIALRGDYDDAMQEARKAMSRHCGGPFSIVEEGEVVIGETTTGVANTRASRNRRSTVTVGTTQTEQETEWRVTYACGVRTIHAAAAPPPPAVPAAPAR